ncbi:MAG: pentapeptide repeat-containing protein [Ktedonobacteraceae bacterium]
MLTSLIRPLRTGWPCSTLVEAHLEGADLGKASLKQAILAGAHLEPSSSASFRCLRHVRL